MENKTKKTLITSGVGLAFVAGAVIGGCIGNYVGRVNERERVVETLQKTYGNLHATLEVLDLTNKQKTRLEDFGRAIFYAKWDIREGGDDYVANSIIGVFRKKQGEGK
ncbi:MAG: hypothetical protein KKD18_02935 [Nanoarchaeota archaeon]|nr:hypothetical protein [Nanoarchaeota archaeon]MBU0977345.1 hypothetical protein [Nanoarchaeota archaeon]